MLSSFFNTSKPIHYLILTLVLILGFVGYSVFTGVFDLNIVLILGAAWFVLVLLQFVITKNELTKSHSYSLFIFTFLIIQINAITSPLNAWVALVFLMLAMRRLWSLKSGKDLTKKIFDAALWIAIASLFHAVSVLFFSVLFIAIFLYARMNIKNWFIPVFAVVSVWICAFTIEYVMGIRLLDHIYNPLDYDPIWSQVSFSPMHTIAVFSWIFIAALCLGFLSKLSQFQQSVLPRFSLLFFMGLLAFGIGLFSFPTFKNAAMLWGFIPISIFMARAVNSLSKNWLKELLLWVPVVLVSLGYLFSFSM